MRSSFLLQKRVLVLLLWGALALLLMVPHTTVHAQTWAPPAVVDDGLSTPRQVLTADVDGDGLDDVIVSDEEDDTIYWYRSNGDDTFDDRQEVLGVPFGLERATITDWNGDGRPDVVVAHSSGVDLGRNIGGSFAQFRLLNGTDLEDVAVADFDEDGRLDVAIIRRNTNAGGELAWYAKENIGFGPKQVITTDVPGGGQIEVTEAFNTGGPDLVVATSGIQDRIAVYSNNPAGSFGSNPGAVPGENFFDSVRSLDVWKPPADGFTNPHYLVATNDGVFDVVFSNSTFDYEVTSLNINASNSAVAGDLDGDDDVDVLMGTFSVSWAENEGDDSFADPETIASESAALGGVASGDVDDDGDADLFATDPTTGQLLFLENRPPAPALGLTPTTLSQTLFEGETGDATLTISNEGDPGTSLDFSFASFAATALLSQPGVELNDTSPIGGNTDHVKGSDPHTGIGHPVLTGAGGPDGFSYTWIDSNEPGGPTFSWTDIIADGTAVSLGDDASETVALPFGFDFYGDTKTEVSIGSNGYLTFGSDGTDFSNDPIPSSTTPNDVIAPFWDDLDPGDGQGTIHYLADAGAGQFIVQYTAVPNFPGPDGPQYTFQVILRDDGSIRFQYLDMGAADLEGATVGIENANASDGLQVAYNTAYIENELAIEIAADPAFITGVSPASGVIESGQSQDVTVTFSAAGLAPDTYQNGLALSTNDPNADAVSISATLTVELSNLPPVAGDDAFTMLAGETLSENVFTNDNDPDGMNAPVLGIVQDPSNGTLDAFEGGGPSGLGDFTYTPDAGFSGVDTFVYEIIDDQGATDQATVAITVRNVPLGTVEVFDDFEDSDVSEYFQFGPAPPARSISNDTPAQNGGSNALAADFATGDGGFVGGFGKNDVNANLDSFLDPRLNVYYKFNAGSPETAFTLEINVQEDENGDGEYNVDDDDEFRMEVRIDGGHGYRLASAEIENLLLNPRGQAGGDGLFNGTVAGVTFAVADATPDDGSGSAEGGQLLIDYVSFTEGQPVESFPPAAISVYDNFEDGLQGGEYFQFGPAPPALSISSDTPPQNGGSNALAADFATGDGGFVGGFGKSDVTLDLTGTSAPRLNFYYKFNAGSENTAFVLEVNVQEDENGGGYNPDDDDEFRLKIRVRGSSTYRLVSTEIDALLRNQNGQAGGDGEFNGTVDAVVVSIANATPDDGSGNAEGGQLLLDAITFTDEGALPVEFSGFDVQTNGGDALLTWSTASETNNAGFAVQHAVADGAFQGIGFVEGAGTTTQPQRYRFAVADLPVGTHRFRLKQVDTDGTFAFSDVQALQVALQEAYRMDAPAPNPTTGRAHIQLVVAQSQTVRVALYDLLGREVRVAFDGPLPAQSERSIAVGHRLSPGVYFLRVTGEHFRHTERLVVVR